MNVNLQNFKRLLIHLVSLVLVMLKVLPKYGNAIQSSHLGTAVTTGPSTNVLFRNFDVQFRQIALSKHFSLSKQVFS